MRFTAFAFILAFIFSLGVHSQDFKGEVSFQIEETPMITVCKPLPLNAQSKYCVTRTSDPNMQSSDVLYFFHGLKGSAEDWAKNTEAGIVRNMWTEKGYKFPVVIAVSFGEFWLLAEKNSSPNSGLLDYFIWQLMPALEKDLNMSIHSRSIWGMSMGGFNAAKIVLRAPELFQKAILTCPASADISPYASAADVKKFVKKYHASSMYVNYAIKLSKEFFPSDEEWNRSNPLVLAQKSFGDTTPVLHLTCGDHDQFGFYSGASKLAEAAQKHKVPLVWEPIKGGKHCAMNPESIGNFFLTDFHR